MNATSEAGEEGNAAQIAYWNDRAAVTWTTLQDRLDAMFAPLTAIALDTAAPVRGEHAIDIGCGCGATVLELARRVGPQGHVLGVDVSGPMAARARERISAAGLANAEVQVSDASEHGFKSHSADLLFSRFGVMFFADPTAAFANLHGAMRANGRMLFAAWRAFAENAWFSVPMQAAGSLLPPSPPMEPNAPGPFAFADSDRVSGMLRDAGWTDVAFTRCDVPVCLAGPGQIVEAAELTTRVGGLARALADVPELKAPVTAAVTEALRAHDGPDGVCLTGSVWLVSARS